MFQSIYTTVITSTQKALGEVSGWFIDSAVDHTVSISKYISLAGSNYIKLQKELNHLRKDQIHIQNIDDNECFRQCLVRYLNPANHHPARVTNKDKDFAETLDFKYI